MSNQAAINIANNRETILKLMQMDNTGELDNIIESAKKSGKLSLSDDASLSYNSNKYVANNVPNSNIITEKANPKFHPNMPKAILESFKNEPGATNTYDSVVDQMGLKPIPRTEKASSVTENVSPSSTAIDYALIKTIIDESVKKYVSALAKKLINENASSKNVITDNSAKMSCMKIGDKFSFITEEGDIYEAKMTFIRNINDK